MKINMGFSDFLRRQRGLRAKRLGKPIEDMTLKEIAVELEVRIDDINQNNYIDERTFQILDYMFNTAQKEKGINVRRYINLISHIKDFEMKKQLTERCAKYIYVYEIDDVERVMIIESQKGNIGNLRSNNVDNNLHDKKEELDTLIGILYSQNIEYIDDLNEVILNVPFKTFCEIYNAFPKEKQLKILKDKLETHPYDLEEYINLINGFKDKLDFLISVGDNWHLIERILEQNKDITQEKIMEHFKEVGVFNENLLRYSEEVKKLSAEELLEELSYFKDEKSRQSVISYYFYEMSKEERLKFILNEKIEKELLEKYYSGIIAVDLSLEEKIEFFKSLTEQQQSHYIREFAVIREKDIDKVNKYFSEILNTIKDNKTKDLFILNVFKEFDLDHNYIIDTIKDGNEEDVDKFMLLNLTDDELISLYRDTDNDFLRAMLVNLSRNQYDGWGWDIDDDGNKDSEPIQYIMVNKENYFSLIMNSKGKKELISLLKLGYPMKENEKEQLMNMINEKYTLDNSENVELLRQVIPILNLEEYRKHFAQIENNSINTYNFWKDKKLSREELTAELEQVKDFKAPIIIKKYINELFLHCDFEIDFPNESFDSLKKRRQEQINVISSFCLKDDINSDVRHIFLEELFDNRLLGDYDRTNEMIRKLILDKNIDMKEKYWILSKSYYDPEQKGEMSELFAIINKEAGREDYNKMFCINEKESDRLISKRELLPYLDNDIVYQKLKELYKNNPDVLDTISPSLLSENIITKIDSELLEFWSRHYVYGKTMIYKDGKNINMLDDILSNDKKAEMFMTMFEKLKEMEAFPEEHMLKIVAGFKYLKDDEIENFECTDENIYKVASVLIYGEEEDKKKHLLDYEIAVKEKCQKKIDDKYATRTELLDALGKRYFNMSYKDMVEVTQKYGADIDIFLKRYNEKKELTEEEASELSSLIIVRNFKEILQIKDKEAIRTVYREYEKEPTMDMDFRERIVLDENIRRVYAKDYLKDIYQPSEKDKKIVNGVEVYSPKNFKMFTHSVAAYGAFSLVNPELSASELWESGDKTNHILCTSFITNSNLAYCKNTEKKKGSIFDSKPNIVLGFANIGINSILMSNVSDISSDTRDIESQKSYRNYSFRSLDNLINNTRMFYNEVSIERRLEDDKTKNILPSYVVCYDEISEESKKVSRDMNIPIVFIDRKDLAIQESKKIETMIETFRDTKEPRLLKDIINQYEGNLVSFSYTRQDLVKKYFNVKKMNGVLEGLISEIKDECENGNHENGIQCLETLQSVFDDEIGKFSYILSQDELRSKRNIKMFDLKQQVDEVLDVYKTSSGGNTKKKLFEEEKGNGVHPTRFVAKNKENTHERSEEYEK